MSRRGPVLSRAETRVLRLFCRGLIWFWVIGFCVLLVLTLYIL
jgi:hypothetical protein